MASTPLEDPARFPARQLKDLNPEEVNWDQALNLTAEAENTLAYIKEELALDYEADRTLAAELEDKLRRLLPEHLRQYFGHFEALGADTTGQIAVRFTLYNRAENTWFLPNPDLFESPDFRKTDADGEFSSRPDTIKKTDTVTMSEYLAEDQTFETVDVPTSIVLKEKKVGSGSFQALFFFSGTAVPQCLLERLIGTSPKNSFQEPGNHRELKSEAIEPDNSNGIQNLKLRRSKSSPAPHEMAKEQWEAANVYRREFPFSYARLVLDEALRRHYREWGIYIDSKQEPDITSIERKTENIPEITVTLKVPSLNQATELLSSESTFIEILPFTCTLKHGQLCFELPPKIDRAALDDYHQGNSSPE
jgi:hypothetical protein